MLAELTTYATLRPQAVDSEVELRASVSYLVNTDHIVEMFDNTTARRLSYKFNVYDDQEPRFVFDVTATLAAIQTLADATAASTKITLNVFEDIQSFNQVTGLTAVTWNFNVSDIVWGENDATGAYARIWYLSGGHKVTPIIVDHNISQIVDLGDTGTTTTTTSSTTTTSA
jgi:hypothetical protein